MALKAKVSTATLIRGCELRLIELHEQEFALTNAQESGEWRACIANEIDALSVRIRNGEISAENVRNAVYDLKAISKAENMVDEIRGVQREISMTERKLTLLKAAKSDGFMIEAGDSYWMEILEAANKQT